MNGMFDNPRAFEPFFTDRVAVNAVREGGAAIRGTFAAVVMPAALDAALSDMSVQQDRLAVSVLIAKTGPNAWNHATPPRIGDVMTWKCMKLSITKVDPMVDEYHQIEARQC